jgi:hypothetical protein
MICQPEVRPGKLFFPMLLGDGSFQTCSFAAMEQAIPIVSTIPDSYANGKHARLFLGLSKSIQHQKRPGK